MFKVTWARLCVYLDQCTTVRDARLGQARCSVVRDARLGWVRGSDICYSWLCWSWCTAWSPRVCTCTWTRPRFGRVLETSAVAPVCQRETGETEGGGGKTKAHQEEEEDRGRKDIPTLVLETSAVAPVCQRETEEMKGGGGKMNFKAQHDKEVKIFVHRGSGGHEG